MDQMRLLLALVLSFLVFMGWNFFFNPEPKQPPVAQLQTGSASRRKTKTPAPSHGGTVRSGAGSSGQG